MPKVTCPQCKTAFLVGEEMQGLKVRCRVCQNTFQIGTSKAVSTAKGGSAAVLTVVARRVGVAEQPAAAPPRRRWGLWISAALAALILPIVGAGGFVAYRWATDGKGASASRTGTLHAGIEIGSKGVKSVVLEVFSDPENGYDVEPQNDPKTVNTTLVAGLAANNEFDPDALKDTARAVAKFHEEARTALKVPEDNIYIVGSSGLFSPLRKKKDLSAAERKRLILRNKEALAQAVRDAAGKSVRFIDAADEAEQSFKGIVPRPQRADAVLYDIGGGNTKGACASSTDTFDTLELPFGTKTYFERVRREIEKSKRPFDAVTTRLAGEALRQPLHAQIERKPSFINRRRVYLAGGVVWALANYVHPEDRRPMVKLTAADLDAFAALLKKEPRAVLESRLAKLDADESRPKEQTEKLRKEVEKDLRRVNDTYKPQELRAGLEVLRALAIEGEFEKKELYFARYGYFGWILSYVSEKGSH